MNGEQVRQRLREMFDADLTYIRTHHADQPGSDALYSESGSSFLILRVDGLSSQQIQTLRATRDALHQGAEEASMTSEGPEQPYGPGAICEACGHFAERHAPAPSGCGGIKGCDCTAMLWQGVRWPRPWLPAPDGLVAR